MASGLSSSRLWPAPSIIRWVAPPPMRSHVGLEVVGTEHEAVVGSRQQQGRRRDTAEAMAKSGVVHVGGPAIPRHRLFGPGDLERDLGVHWWSRGVREQAPALVRGGDVEVDEVTVLASAELDPESERRGPGSRADPGDVAATSAATQPPNESPTTGTGASNPSMNSCWTSATSRVDSMWVGRDEPAQPG